MPKIKSHHMENKNRATLSIIKQPTSSSTPSLSDIAKMLGRKGGLKGGKARAKSLSAKRRSDIARKAGKASGKARSKK